MLSLFALRTTYLYALQSFVYTTNCWLYTRYFPAFIYYKYKVFIYNFF